MIVHNLVQQYINGWRENDLPMILSCLTEDCIVIESHGPTYHRMSDIEQWFEFWLKAKSKIKKWDISSFNFCESKKTAFVEWDFSCISNDIEYAFPGISVIQFVDEKISFIHEYRMTHKAYDWEKDELKSGLHDRTFTT
ncbi:MAG TPA: nuclear transport factor 2 family protein [Gammaproteobacteria bacterium]|nr:nuclear transport factor 2 family protein [Gammaproteobacteria bacterium]